MNHLAKILQPLDTVAVLQAMHTVLQEYYEIKWWQQVSRTEAVRGTRWNKLRTYSKFTTSITAESFIKVILPKGHWKIRIETGLYENVN